MDLEKRLRAMKSKAAEKISQRLGSPIIEIDTSTFDPKAFKGETIPDGVYLIASGPIVRKPVDPNPVVFRHVELDPFTGAPKKVIEERRVINVGDTVLMEYAQGIVETVKIDVIHNGIAYGLGVNDGESYCAPFKNCDKVPY